MIKLGFSKLYGAALLAGAVLASSAFSQESALSIMEKNRDTDVSKTSSSTAVMTLTNKKGGVRVREVVSFKKNSAMLQKPSLYSERLKTLPGSAILCGNTKNPAA